MAVPIVLVTMLTAFQLVGFSEKPAPLPLQFRVSRTDLSGLPVSITDMKSCGCWVGPRGQAQKKFKFSISNGSADIVNIGGGETSAIRLIVAYPSSFAPGVTVPDVGTVDGEASVGNPPGATIPIARDYGSVEAARLEDGAELFGIPIGYEAWAIPPVPNFVVERLSDETVSFTTSVGRSELLPGEAFSDARLGYGAWVFNVPMDPGLYDFFLNPILVPTDDEDIRLGFLPSRRLIASHLIVLGVAAFAHEEDSVALVGFAPAPPDAEQTDPAGI